MGSGRRFYLGAKATTDSYKKLDIRRWKREGLLIPGSSFVWQWSYNDNTTESIRVSVEENRLHLDYRHNSPKHNEWQEESYPINLSWTNCHLGGQRPWFICPTHNCGQRVALLYGGEVFACRHQ